MRPPERDESATYHHPRPWVARQMRSELALGGMLHAWEVVCPSKAGGTELTDVVANYLSRRDALLIAAAHEVFDALSGLLCFVCQGRIGDDPLLLPGCISCPSCRPAREAIAKREGRELEPPPCVCGAPADGHYPECQEVLRRAAARSHGGAQ